MKIAVTWLQYLNASCRMLQKFNTFYNSRPVFGCRNNNYLQIQIFNLFPHWQKQLSRDHCQLAGWLFSRLWLCTFSYINTKKSINVTNATTNNRVLNYFTKTSLCAFKVLQSLTQRALMCHEGTNSSVTALNIVLLNADWIQLLQASGLEAAILILSYKTDFCLLLTSPECRKLFRYRSLQGEHSCPESKKHGSYTEV